MSSKALNAAEGAQEQGTRLGSDRHRVQRMLSRWRRRNARCLGHRSTPRASGRTEVTSIPVLIPQRARWHTSSPTGTGSDSPAARAGQTISMSYKTSGSRGRSPVSATDLTVVLAASPRRAYSQGEVSRWGGHEETRVSGTSRSRCRGSARLDDFGRASFRSGPSALRANARQCRY